MKYINMAKAISNVLTVGFIEPGRVGFYSGSGQVAWANIPETTIKDFEVVSKLELNKLIAELLTNFMAIGGSVILVFSSTSAFEKDFPTLTPEDKNNETQRFFDSVPFERVLAHVYSNQAGWKAVALNRDMYEALRDGFQLAGFDVIAVVPEYAVIQQGVKGDDPNAAQQIIKKIETLK